VRWWSNSTGVIKAGAAVSEDGTVKKVVLESGEWR
jgi:hypothetical protein